MKSEEYYKNAETNRIKNIKENAKYSHSPELMKLMEDVFSDGLSRLIKDVIELNDIKEINNIINEYEHSVTERNLDLLKEFLLLNKENIKDLDIYWIKELKAFSKNSIFQAIQRKEGYANIDNEYIRDKYSLFLKSFQLLNDQE